MQFSIRTETYLLIYTISDLLFIYSSNSLPFYSICFIRVFVYFVMLARLLSYLLSLFFGLAIYLYPWLLKAI